MLSKRHTIQASLAQTKTAGYVLFLFLLLATSVFYINLANADGGQSNIPGVTLKTKSYAVPENISAMSTDEVSDLRDAHQKELDMAHKAVAEKQVVEENMLNELMKHDLVRLEIIDVIPQLIEDYDIEGKFKKTLMGYRSTFADEVMESRKNVESLGDYQSYDFRFAAVYMSMLFAFQEHPEFYERLKVDMKEDDTPIGAYRKKLDDSYDGVDEARIQMDLVNNVDDIENLVTALDAELARRSN
jgi:hypothetical protein